MKPPMDLVQKMRPTAEAPAVDRIPEHERRAAEGPPVALLAIHGMGEQVRYGTMEEAMELLQAAAARRDGRVVLERRIHLPDGDRFVPCGELLVEIGERRQRVHVFEAYWAPLAEGRISTWESFKFLLRSAWEGVWKGRRFVRYLFGNGRALDGESKWIPWTTIPGLFLAASSMAALLAFDIVFVSILAAGIMVASEPNWFPGLRGALVADYAGVLMLLGVAAICLLPLFLASVAEREKHGNALNAYARVVNTALRVCAILLVVIGVDLIFRCLSSAAPDLNRLSLFGLQIGHVVHWNVWPPHWLELCRHGAAHRSLLMGLGLGTFLLSSLVRSFVRQYIGDVAIYVSGHKSSRFYETRHAIQDIGLAEARFVLGRRQGEGPLYERVVLMGHSLGSVIAYDVLNRLILDDAAGAGLDASRRTAALVTYGSPLDKIAFVFRSQKRRGGSVREAMVASLQPLIDDAGARSLWWVNVYSDFDWIGAKLDFYDRDQGQPPAARRIINLRDGLALTPIAAHNEHGRGVMLPGVVLDAVLDQLDRNEDIQHALEGTLPAGETR